MPKNYLKLSPTPIFGPLDNFRVYGSQSTAHNDAVLNGISVKGAANDFQAAQKFLMTYEGSSATVNAYRRELERFLQWSWRVKQRSVVAFSRDEIEEFIRFSMSPPAAWIGTKNVARFLRHDGELHPNADWRPYIVTSSMKKASGGAKTISKQYLPSQASIRSTFAVLSSFYDFLIEESLSDANPVSTIRQKSKFLRKDQNAAIVRRISNLQWDYVIDTTEDMAAAEPEVHERTLFIMNCLFAMYLRISELVADERSFPVMGDFQKDQDDNWWFHVTGKGNKDRTIAMSDAMLKALKRYRRSLGLPPLPGLNEEIPLLKKNRGVGAISSSRQVRRIVQMCFDNAYEQMRADGLESDAQELKSATVHWLRHTGISEDVKSRPREHVRDDAGHATMATTDRYIESDRRERHSSGKRKPIKDL